MQASVCLFALGRQANFSGARARWKHAIHFSYSPRHNLASRLLMRAAIRSFGFPRRVFLALRHGNKRARALVHRTTRGLCHRDCHFHAVDPLNIYIKSIGHLCVQGYFNKHQLVQKYSLLSGQGTRQKYCWWSIRFHFFSLETDSLASAVLLNPKAKSQFMHCMSAERTHTHTRIKVANI